MRIKYATMEDLAAVAAVEAKCFPPAEAATEKEFTDRIRYYGNHFWLMYEGKKLIAFVDGFVTDEPDLTDEMYENAAMHNENGTWQMISGVNTLPDYPELCRKLSVECNIDEDTELPPVLMFHGTKDRTINPRVSVEVYNRLKQCGKIVKLYFLEGADHGGSEFWTEEMQQIIIQFMEEK